MTAWPIYICFGGVILLSLFSGENRRAIRITALFIAIASFFCAISAVFRYGGRSEIVTITRVPWVPALGIEYHLAVDGISLVLLLLTGIAAIAGILFSWNVEHRTKEFFCFYLALIGAVYGVFLSFDLFLFFVFYELVIVPKYFLIAIWGSTNREYGAMKLALYSFVGSALILIALIAAFVVSGAHSFNLLELSKFQFPVEFQMWALPVMLLGFAILAGIWPFHTWAPTGHVAAPTAASMLLAGVVMKLGSYGVLRVAMTLFPKGLEDWQTPVLGLGSWREVFALLALIGIIYGAMVALAQKDFKFVIGYSSVSHMGFVLLGLMTLTQIGFSGAVLQMFSHGVIGGLLFAVVGRMVYDRTHTRDLTELEKMPLSGALPFAAFTFVVAGMASMGLPGFSGFVAELQIIIGAWRKFPTFAVLTGIGILVGVAYTLRAIQRSFFGATAAGEHSPLAGGEAAPSEVAGGNGAHSSYEPISMPERFGAAMLIACTVLIGLHPRLLLDLIIPALNPSGFFASLLKGIPP